MATFRTKAVWMQNIFKSYTEPGGTLEIVSSLFQHYAKKKKKKGQNDIITWKFEGGAQ